MMKKILIAVVLSLVMVLTAIGPASAITDGVPDGNGHPMVVLILMEVGGEPMYRCSGTLISPYVVLTAGHCTSNYPDPEPYSGMRIFFDSDVQSGMGGITNNYPYGGLNSIEADRWYTLPGFESAPFFYNDVGVIVLKEPFYPGGGTGTYAKLPTANQFDAFKTRRGLQKVTFTSVGYGLQASTPDPAYWKTHNVKVRMVAHPRLIQINVPGATGNFSMLLSNNTATGGTCFGDSGGPNFLGNSLVVAGVTSFGKNGNCAGTGGVFRVDRQRVLDFINLHINDTPN